MVAKTTVATVAKTRTKFMMVLITVIEYVAM
jgi:hypothetical protein